MRAEIHAKMPDEADTPSELTDLNGNYKMSFKERARLGMEMLSKEPPLTSKEMLESVRMVHENSAKNKKRKAK